MQVKDSHLEGLSISSLTPLLVSCVTLNQSCNLSSLKASHLQNKVLLQNYVPFICKKPRGFSCNSSSGDHIRQQVRVGVTAEAIGLTHLLTHPSSWKTAGGPILPPACSASGDQPVMRSDHLQNLSIVFCEVVGRGREKLHNHRQINKAQGHVQRGWQKSRVSIFLLKAPKVCFCLS